MHILGYDEVLVPAIDRTLSGCYAMSDAIKASTISGLEDERDKAQNAIISAHSAKVIFDREFRGKEQPDSDMPGHKILVIKSDHQTRALKEMLRHLKDAYTLAREIKEALLNREYTDDPELRPKFIETQEELREAISRRPRERKERSAHSDRLREAQERMPEHGIVKAIDNAGFIGIAMDAAGTIQTGLNQSPGTERLPHG